MNKDQILSQDARLLEVILYIENEALEEEKLVQLSGLPEERVDAALKELKENYDDSMHGIQLSHNDDDTYSFTPCTDLYEALRATYGKKVDRRLSRAALETLSIVAYSQPITRREIDNIRGVTSDTIVRLLREREYIKVVGRKDVPGHPCLYGTSRKFLYEFNLQSISDLPKLSDIDRMRFDKDQGDDLL